MILVCSGHAIGYLCGALERRNSTLVVSLIAPRVRTHDGDRSRLCTFCPDTPLFEVSQGCKGDDP